MKNPVDGINTPGFLRTDHCEYLTNDSEALQKENRRRLSDTVDLDLEKDVMLHKYTRLSDLYDINKLRYFKRAKLRVVGYTVYIGYIHSHINICRYLEQNQLLLDTPIFYKWGYK